MGGRSAQDVDEGLLGVLPPVKGAQENRALDFGADRIGTDRIVSGRSVRQQILKLTEPRLLRQPGRPAARADGTIGQDRRVLFQSGHDVSKFRRLWLQSPCYPLIRKQRVSMNFAAIAAVLAGIAG
jgi:hypothetical protein